MTVTPVKKGTKKPGSGSGSSKMKQSSLMSFFKPAAAKTPSSPLKAKNEPLHAESDKENDSSMMEDATTETPLTSETNNVVDKHQEPNLHSSPVKREPPTETKQPQKPSNKVTSRRDRSISYAESDVSDDEDIPSRRKRRRVVESDDDDDEFKPADDGEDDDDEHMSDFVVNENESDVASMSEDDDDDEDTYTSRKVSKKKRGSESVSSRSPSTKPIDLSTSHLGSKFTSSSSYTASVSNKPAVKPKPQKRTFAKENEERHQWLVNIRDAEKRPVDDPNYDSRTLYIPSSAWAKFTAFEKQYWEIKSKMWDTVVFFKKGKFYELYENDAMIANTQFDLKIAGGGRANMKLAGIPEMSFEYWAKEFISNGYKVAKVDQKESLLAKEMRGGGTKEEKIIKRELTGILTGGTLTDLDMISDDMATYCLSIKESTTEDGEKIFGACFVDTATSEVNLIELKDDEECSRLDTLITQIKPKEILCEKNNLCSAAIKIIKFNAHNSHQIWNHLNPFSEFWDYDTTAESLAKGKYYEAQDLDDYSNYPQVLLEYKDKHHVAFNAFGGMLYYLKMLKLDHSIMSLANIKSYEISKRDSNHMLLDGITLTNLEMLNNSFDGGDKGTLFKLLNRAITPFGRRMLKRWVLHPLMNTEEINARYDAIDFLINNEPELRVELESTLGALPDLERLIARVHGRTLRFRDFLKVVEGFEAISNLFKAMDKVDLANSGALEKYVNRFPTEVHQLIKSWEEAFDRQEALANVVVPAKGVDEEFDASIASMDNLESQLNDYLRQYKKEYKSHEICFRDSGKEIYLIEMPIKIKSIPKDWQQMGATSKVKRYWSPEVKTTARKLMEQRELHKSVCENLISRMYEKFDKHYESWMSAISITSSIDCLIALTKTSETISYPSCRPKFSTDGRSKIDFKELRHPCFLGTNDFIPNDVVLGGDGANFNLLTGANAAGKSTLMRTTALAVVMSQIGCYLPASSAQLTPVDKIMTRLGANDNIMQGKSTFFVELSETKKILSNATSNSLVILDELGRGGSSSDGYAIAEAVLHHLATHVQPLGFFATHYGSMGLSFVNHPSIKAMRMGIIVDRNSRNITFLYKLEEGTASGSFGMNVAAMCGINSEIVDKAEVAAKEFEQTSKLRDEHEKQHISKMSIGLQSDFSWAYNRYNNLQESMLRYEEAEKVHALECVFRMIETL
ncbi:DNA mismatch repair protein msh6 [Candidozyma auris]|uniref:DNA mismatch repair protein n=1 Tax=Candidozyma auris TaxID=498019 RepID=A0A2H0ZXA1_CANAR|nr:hypothetical protein QG37_00252 [[Candida] auris]PIS54883.1 hypothetical protein B9J08_002030 [[Candida] auris]